MIIQIAGTSGSGKTHVVRQLMAMSTKDTSTHFIEGRASPIGYGMFIPGLRKGIHIVGSYDAASGGCDSIKHVPTIFDLVKKAHSEGRHVVFEGLFTMNLTRGPALVDGFPGEVVVILLTTPMATCFASIDARRADKGLEGLPPERHKNTKGHYIRARNYTARMREAGARVKRVSREEALPCLLELLENA